MWGTEWNSAPMGGSSPRCTCTEPDCLRNNSTINTPILNWAWKWQTAHKSARKSSDLFHQRRSLQSRSWWGWWRRSRWTRACSSPRCAWRWRPAGPRRWGTRTGWRAAWRRRGSSSGWLSTSVGAKNLWHALFNETGGNENQTLIAGELCSAEAFSANKGAHCSSFNLTIMNTF